MKVLKLDSIQKLKFELDQQEFDLSAKDYETLLIEFNLSEIDIEVEFNDSVKLLLPAGDTQSTNKDFENCSLVYKALDGLTESSATDERIWATLSLREYRDYSFKRWPKKGMRASYYLEHFFAPGNRDYTQRNSIGRLWWTYRIAKRMSTSDADVEKQLKHLLHNSDYRMQLLERSGVIANNTKLLSTYNQIHMEHTAKGNHYDRDKHNDFCKEVKKLSGTKHISIMDDSELRSSLQNIHNEVYS
jgi:hypothetical protein